MPNTQQWNVPAATAIADTDKLSGSQGPNLGQDKTFSWTLIKTTLSTFFASTFSGLQSQITALQNLTKTNPTYTPPGVTEDVTGTQPGIYEVATPISGSLAISLFVGDSGGPGSSPAYNIHSDIGSVSATNSYAFSFNASTDGNHLWGIINYLTGATKNDSLGNPYPTGKITAGTTTGTHLLWIGSYGIFYGPVSGNFADITNPHTYSGLSDILLANVSNNQFILNTGSTADKFLIA